ncbi:hypothetical protein DL98DRAFT_267784 [Cadophora sp. DSE1049]|nr:hypothetical protein DL98DRAFT_267784 [Cadophora sp. DSE1049]
MAHLFDCALRSCQGGITMVGFVARKLWRIFREGAIFKLLENLGVMVLCFGCSVNCEPEPRKFHP